MFSPICSCITWLVCKFVYTKTTGCFLMKVGGRTGNVTENLTTSTTETVKGADAELLFKGPWQRFSNSVCFYFLIFSAV